MSILVSIITINYNNLIGLKKTFNSVVIQNNAAIEYIIIDGGSKDGTHDFLKQQASHIAYWVSEDDTGIYNAMNKGILAAKGEYLLFLNSGDELCNENIIDIFLDFKKENPIVDIFYGDCIHKFQNNSTEIRTMPKELTLEWFFNRSIIHGSSFIKRSLFFKYGLYDEEYKIVADWLFFFKIFLQPNNTFLHFPHVVCVFEDGGISTKISSQNLLNYERAKGIQALFNKEILQIFEEYKKLKSQWKKLRLSSIISLVKSILSIIQTSLTPFKKATYTILYAYNTIHTKINYNRFKLRYEQKSKQIPIIINNRNRVSFPSQLIYSLEKRGYRNIYIIDNDSTYEEIHSFYKHLPYKIYYLGKNEGFCALWDSYVFNDFKNREYIYTDSDVVLSDSCSEDIVCKMLFFLYKYKKIDKVGLGLEINDLPDFYPLKKKVVDWESSLLNNAKKLESDVVDAPVDTTFALYRKNAFGPAGSTVSIRITGNNQIKHLPWYIDLNHLSDEEKYYIDHANTGFYAYWTGLIQKKL